MMTRLVLAALLAAAAITPLAARDLPVELPAALGREDFWTGSPAADQRRRVLLALLAAERRLDPAVPDPKALVERGPGAATALTNAALAYLDRRAGGAAVAAEEALAALRRLEHGRVTPALALASTELALVADLGGWRRVGTRLPPSKRLPPAGALAPELATWEELRPPKPEPELAALRARLVQSGDLSSSHLAGGPSMDAQTAAAVRRFQARHGLADDGVIGPRTLAALNQPVTNARAAVRINLRRAPPSADRSRLARYVEVNVPGFELKLVEAGVTTLRSRVIVGDLKSPTPIFDDILETIEVQPSWYVPRSIEAELVEKEALRPGYLAANGFYWRHPAHGGADVLVQRPGPENALGRVKFLFPNHHAVYLHDTPQRGLFSRSRRSLSHGCVRVEKSFELALALLRGQGWDVKRLEAAFAGAKTRRIDLAAPVPVFLDYRTAFVDGDGRLQLRADLYGHDAAGVIRFDGKGLPAPGRPEVAATPATQTVQVGPLPPPAGTIPAAFAGPLPAPRPL